MESDRLILRRFRKTDLKDFYEYAKNENVGPNAGWNKHKSLRYSKAVLKGYIYDNYTYAIELKSENKMIGSISFNPNLAIKEFKDLKQLELGYSLNYDYWNHGYAKEAARLMIKYAFNTLKIERLWCGHFSYNERSKNVINSLGFKYYKNINYYSKGLDKYIDVCMYYIDKDDYKEI